MAVQHCRDTLVSADGCYRASRHDLVTPNSGEKKTPNNSQSDKKKSLFRSGQFSNRFGLVLQFKLWLIELLCAKL